MIADGRNRRQRVPHRSLAAQLRGLHAVAIVQLDDHFRAARQNHFRRSLHRLLFRVGEHVVATGGFEHVVEKPVSAARVDVAERSGIAAEDEECLETWFTAHPPADRIEVRFHSGGELIRPIGRTDPRADRPHRRSDVGQRPVLVAVERNRRAVEALLQVFLRVVNDDQVRLQREDSLDVRIDQSPHARDAIDLWRVPIVGADADDAVACAHREDHFGDGRDEGDDSAGRFRGQPHRAGNDHEQEGSSSHRNRVKSSHRKKGPPMNAVTMPTGSSIGASADRATRSQPIRKAPPNSADAGSTRR